MTQHIPLGDSRGKADIIWQMLSFNPELSETHSKYEMSIYFHKACYWCSKNKIKQIIFEGGQHQGYL